MASTYKTFLANDVATTKTLLHEAIPITGTIASGTYNGSPAADNIKRFAHGMFESTYDYPYLSSSANHIFDITAGYASTSALSGSDHTQNAKKINVYNQFAQVLVGYDIDGNIQNFDRDGEIKPSGITDKKITDCFFLTFSRLLTKDEVKKGSFRLSLYLSASSLAGAEQRFDMATIGDYGAATVFKTNSPTGEYGLLYSSSLHASATSLSNPPIGHIYYQAGVAVLTSSLFIGAYGGQDAIGTSPNVFPAVADSTGRQVNHAMTGTTISQLAGGFRHLFHNLEFNNTTELNSTMYFCRANTGEYNYSSNPTYLDSSKIVVKGNNAFEEPASYITTVGLYSSDNELLATAKLSEPLKKAPSNEITLRVRLDY